MAVSCVALFSGGLDSLLAARLMAVQGLHVVAVHAVSCFLGREGTGERMARLRERAARLGVADIVFPDIGEEVMGAVRRPRFGYGKNLNPCIDCRLLTIAAGFRVMRERGASFVVSGEVAGQRPMSQRRDALAIADREAAFWGFPGLLLRPLSARLLPATVPEREGWVDSARLYGISGRSRSGQAALAAELGVDGYPTPAGGCLLTDAGFSARLADLMRFAPGWSAADVELLKTGRHFLPDERTRVVVGRDEGENRLLETLAEPGDLLFINAQKNGALVLLRGEAAPEAEALAAGLAVHYSGMRGEGGARVARWNVEAGEAAGREFAAAVVDPDNVRRAEAAMKKASRLPPPKSIKTP